MIQWFDSKRALFEAAEERQRKEVMAATDRRHEIMAALGVDPRTREMLTGWESAGEAFTSLKQLWAAIDVLEKRLRRAGRTATYTHEFDESAGHLYRFTLSDAAPKPYTTQRRVEAIIDIADDGTLAGVELIDDMPPPPA